MVLQKMKWDPKKIALYGATAPRIKLSLANTLLPRIVLSAFRCCPIIIRHNSKAIIYSNFGWFTYAYNGQFPDDLANLVSVSFPT